MKPEELDNLEALAKAATPGPRVMSPRHVKHSDQIEQGANWEDVARHADPEEWLGWECNKGFYSPGRGDFSGPDAVFLAATDPQKILAMITHIRELEAKFAASDAEVTRLGRAVAVQWIDVSERLPEWASRDDTPCVIDGRPVPPTLFSERVLVAFDSGIVRTDRLIAIEGSAPWFDTYGKRVRYWMPTPPVPAMTQDQKGDA